MNEEKQDLIFEIVYDVLQKNHNWIKLQDLINEVLTKINLYQYSIYKKDVIEFINKCEQSEYIAIARNSKDDNNGFVCGYWVGLNSNDD